MSKIYCFKSIPDSPYGREINKYFTLVPKWDEVIEKVGHLIGSPISAIAHDAEELWIDVDEVSKEAAKLFTIDGKLKRNSKKSNEIRKSYLEIIKKVGLENFIDRQKINFVYGIMRTNRAQTLGSFRTSDNDVYLKANYDMLSRDKTNGYIEPITHIQYEEKYLDELRKQEDRE